MEVGCDMASYKSVKVGEYWRKESKRPMTAIKSFCAECMGSDRRKEEIEWHLEDVKGCTDDLCPLLSFRFGRNPNPSKKRVELGKRFGFGHSKERLQ